MMRKCMKEFVKENPGSPVEKLIEQCRGNVGFVFTNGDLGDVREILFILYPVYPVLDLLELGQCNQILVVPARRSSATGGVAVHDERPSARCRRLTS